MLPNLMRARMERKHLELFIISIILTILLFVFGS